MKSEHALTEVFFAELRRRLIQTLAITFLLAGVGAWLMGGGKTDPFTLAVFAVMLLGFMPFVAWMNLRKQTASFRSLRIVADETGLRRIQDGYPPLGISWSEIAAVEEYGDRGLVVRGGRPPRQLFVLRTLERYDELRARLASVRPIDTKPAQGNTALTTLSMVGAMAAMVVFYRSEFRPVVVTLGLLMTAGLVWCFIAIQRSGLFDERLKRWAWAIWLVIPSLLFRVYQVLVRD